jgi:hypothetical protein
MFVRLTPWPPSSHPGGDTDERLIERLSELAEALDPVPVSVLAIATAQFEWARGTHPGPDQQRGGVASRS